MSRSARLLATAVLLASMSVGCVEAPPERDSPAFAGGTESTGSAAADAITRQAEQIGLEPCPPTDRGRASGEDALPALRLDCLGPGPAVDVAGLTGRPIVLNVWASWCAPCRDELPLLARAHAEHGDEVAFLGIDVADGSPETALRLLEESGVTYPSVVDPEARSRAALGWTGLPLTVFADADGRVIARERSPMSSAAELDAALREHLDVS